MLIQVTSTSTACSTASEPKPCYRFSMTISRITENAYVFHIAGGPAKQEVVPVVKAYGKQISSQNKKVNAHLGTQYVCDVKVQCWIVLLTRRITVSVCMYMMNAFADYMCPSSASKYF